MGLFFLFGGFHFPVHPEAVRGPRPARPVRRRLLRPRHLGIRLAPPAGADAPVTPIRGCRPSRRQARRLAITMTPTGRALRYRPGQFAFASFGAGAPHPFTISKAPGEDGSIRMTVARLGDFTSRLTELLTVGAGVRIEGPFGRFERPRNPGSRISGSRPASASRPSSRGRREWTRGDNPATLVYCVRNADGAAHLRELDGTRRQAPQFHADRSTPPRRRVGRRRTPSWRRRGWIASNLSIAFCGLGAMRKALSKSVRGKRRAGSQVPIRRVRDPFGHRPQGARRAPAGSHGAAAPGARGGVGQGLPDPRHGRGRPRGP